MIFFKKKISYRLFVSLMLVAVIPVVIIGYQAYRAAQVALTETAFLHISTIAEDHANHLETWFQERLDDIRVLSQFPTVRGVCEHYCLAGEHQPAKAEDVSLLRSIIALTQGKSPSYTSIHILAPSGEIIVSTDPDSEDVGDIGLRSPLFRQLMAREEPVISSIHQHTDSSWRMHLIAPVKGHDGQTVALILVVLDASKTLDPVMSDRVGLGESGESYLVDAQGRIITEPRYLNRSEAFSRTFDTIGIREALNRRNGTAIYENYVGREVVGSYLWLPRFEWALLAEMGKDEIMTPLDDIKTAVVVTAALVSLLCLLLALTVAHQVSRPITRMAAAAREIADGRLDQRILFFGDDEIGTLASSFNTMTQKLSSLITSLRHKEESLQEAYNELVATQEQLVRSERMAAIGELVASVVHEMRSPLTSIKLNLQIIGRSLGSDEVLSEHHKIALDQANQLERMFSDLLNYSKPLALHRVRTNASDLMDASLLQLQDELANQNISVEKEIEGDLPSILCDADKVKQVLVNVLKNAVEATAPNGSITIAAKSSECGREPCIAFTVHDNGPGIPLQHQDRIFQPFFTTKKKGTGLGLAIVRKIMDAHGGRVSITSENGKGTTARVYLPII